MDPSNANPELERLQRCIDRVETRLENVREASSSCRRRMDEWFEAARIRNAFANRALTRGRLKLGSLWLALEKEALEAADLEREQMTSLDHQHDVLELTARCTAEDYEELRRDGER